MPLTTETAIVPLGGWPRGLNRDVFELQLDAQETPDCLNVDFGLRGEFDVRDGYAQADSVAGIGAVAFRLIPYIPASGTDLLVAVQESDGSIFTSTDLTSFTDSTNGLGTYTSKRQWPVHSAILDDSLYLFSQRGNTWRWDGASWVEITSTTLDETGTAASPQAPRAATACTHNSRVWAGHVTANGSTDRSRVMWSTTPVENAGDAGGNRWKATAFIDVQDDDGTEVRHIMSFQSNLLVFKDNSMFIIAGVDEDSFTLYPVDEQVGTTAPMSVARSESDVFFFDPAVGVHVFDGVKVTRIDGAINNYILQGMRSNRAYKAHGHISDGKYFLTVPWGTDEYPSRTFVFDTRLGAWAEYDYGWYDTALWNANEYTVGNGNANGVFTFRQADTTDLGTGIGWYLETIWFPNATDQGMTRHRLRRADLWVEADSGTMTVEMFVDGVESAVWTQAVTASTNRVRLPSYGALWEQIKFKVSGTTT